MSPKTRKKTQKEGVQLRCRYCDIKDTCRFRERKERYENEGVITLCQMTPNRPKKQKKPKQLPY